MVLESFLGDTLVKSDGTKVQTSELSTDKGGVIGIYHSAHWCPPCRGFTPKLASIYNELKNAGKDFEIIFVSWDNDERTFKRYHKEMPWPALPYRDRDMQDALVEKYQVRGIPCLIFLEADTGTTILPEGRDVIAEYGAAGFPFTKKRLKDAKMELQRKKEEALRELSDFQFLGRLSIGEKSDEDFDIETLHKCEAIAFAFMRGGRCQGSNIVLPKLIDIQQKMGKDKLHVILIPMMDDGDADFSEETLAKLNNVLTVSRGAKAQEVADKFKIILKEIDPPHVLMIDAREGSSLKIVEENAARPIYFHGEAAFPWSDDAIKALEEREEALKQDMREKQKNLEFFTPSENCHIVDKQGSEVTLVTLQSTAVVGIYFSAHWCGPCRAFTPRLVEMYNKCKEEGKSFEIVFLSSDSDEESFDDYYAEMPWCALKYEDRLMKETLSDIFEVDGVPTLILLTGEGEKITDEGRTVVSMGSDYFPWAPEDLERGRADEAERKARALAKAKEDEENSYIEQAAAGKIPLRRHKGEISEIKIGLDHEVVFNTFATVIAPTAVIPRGKKAWYEVTFNKGSGVSQVGWATSDFRGCDGYSPDGVGDDTDSWGYDGQRNVKWFGGSTRWGKKFEPSNDHVLGVAVDMENGKILFGLDGDWGEPMGVAFDHLDIDTGLFPAITGLQMTVSVNFGDSEMKFGPPDDTYEKVFDVVER